MVSEGAIKLLSLYLACVDTVNSVMKDSTLHRLLKRAAFFGEVVLFDVDKYPSDKSPPVLKDHFCQHLVWSAFVTGFTIYYYFHMLHECNSTKYQNNIGN